MKLTVVSAEIVQGNPSPILALMIRTAGGQVRRAIIGWEQKMLFRGYDLVFLGAEWEGVVPPIGYTVEGVQRQARGCTDDPVILKLTRDYFRLRRQKPDPLGPLDVPASDGER